MPRFAANLTMLFNEHGFLERFEAAAKAGFEGVEYLFPYDYDAQDLARRLKDHGLVQVLHHLPAGDWAEGERGIACLPGREAEFRDGVQRAIHYAKALGCPQLNCLAGIVPADVTPGDVEATLATNLKYADAELAKADIRLLVEAVNTRDIPGFAMHRTAQVVAFIEKHALVNTWLQYDAYHMQVMEGDLTPTLTSQFARIAHVQIADTPGRNEPGTGEINYPFLMGRLDALGYTGWVGCEYKPRAGTTEGLAWMKSMTSSPGEREAP